MKEAFGFVQGLSSELRTNSEVTLRQFGDDRWVVEAINRACRHGAMELMLKTEWIGQVPWLVVRADDPEVARECLRQFAEAPDRQQIRFGRPNPESDPCWKFGGGRRRGRASAQRSGVGN